MLNSNELDKIKKDIHITLNQLINNNQLNDALEIINEYENSIGNDLEIIQAKSLIYIIEGKYELAKKILKQAIKIDDSNTDTYYNLGYIYQISNELNNANKYYELAKQHTSDIKLINEINQIKEDLLYAKNSTAKRVLVFAHIFPPVGGSGVQRTLKFVKYLINYGWEPIVVTVGKTNYPLIDETLLAEIPDGVRIIRIDEDYTVDNKIFTEIYNLFDSMRINKQLLEVFKCNFLRNSNNIAVPDVYILWTNKVLKVIEEYIDISTIDLIYTTSGPYSDHIIGYCLKNIYNKPWVADFRDEWTNNPYANYDKENWVFKIHHQLETEIIDKADRIINVTPKSTLNYNQLFNMRMDKLETITNGYDESDFKDIEPKKNKNDKFTIVHNGLFYGIRNPLPILKAINNLICNNKIDKDKIKFCLSWNENENDWINFIFENKLENIVEVFGYVSHQDSLKIAVKADLLVLIVGPGSKSKAMYPGKLFEYLRLNKPILSLSPNNSVVDELIKSLNRGYNIDFNQIAEIEDILFEEYSNWLQDNQVEFKIDKDIEQFERKKLTKKLAKLFDSLVPVQTETDVRPKLAFFSIKNGDKFLGNIIKSLSKDYRVKKIIVEDFKQINEGMEWADICWFEWCDDLVAYGSTQEIALRKKVICRLHRYEVFTENANKVNWKNVDELIVVTNHLIPLLEKRVPDIQKLVSINVVNNGIDLSRYTFKNRAKGYNLAFVGDLNFRKNPADMIKILYHLVKKDARYKLFIAGEFTDPLLKEYIIHLITNLKVRDHVVFDGWKEDINKWLEDKDYILATTYHESFGFFIGEAMAKGIKPIIHNFLQSNEIWPVEYLFTTNDEAINMIESESYSSKQYRDFILNYYSLEDELNSIKTILDKLFRYNKSDVFQSLTYKDNLYLKQSETPALFMNPNMFYNRFKHHADKEWIIQQIQNQLKHIGEYYFNGYDHGNPKTFENFIAYLIELLDADFFRNNQRIKELINIISMKFKQNNNELSLDVVEDVLYNGHSILHDLINNSEINSRQKEEFIFENNADNKEFSEKDVYVQYMYDNLYKLMNPIEEYIKVFIIHGSMSTLDYTKYSDVDTLLILNKVAFKSIETLKFVRERISEVFKYLRSVDSLSHHGLFIINELDLRYYPQSYLPLEVMKHSTKVIGEDSVHFNIRNDKFENLNTLWVLAHDIRMKFATKWRPENLYDLKQFTSRLLLLPTLYLEVFEDKYVYKKYSFGIAQSYFTKEAWKSIEIATSIRNKWNSNSGLNINKKYFYYSAILAEECINLIFKEKYYDLAVLKNSREDVLR